MEYVSVDVILTKLFREIEESDINEGDVIEYIGEALSFLPIKGLLQQSVAFLEVKNYSTEVPHYLKYVIQVARNRAWNSFKEENISCTPQIVLDSVEEKEDDYKPVLTDCQGRLIGPYEVAYYRPFFDLQYEYKGWTRSSYYKNTFSPVRLANNNLFHNIVCKELTPEIENLYRGCEDTYALIGGLGKSVLRFSFKEGQVALAYLKVGIDETTGYPLVPDDISLITAITYYCKWKISERKRWEGREGFIREAQDAEAHWLKYVKQTRNKVRRPKTRDDFQNLKDSSLYMIPDHNKYNNFFGNLNR